MWLALYPMIGFCVFVFIAVYDPRTRLGGVVPPDGMYDILVLGSFFSLLWPMVVALWLDDTLFG